MLTVSDYFAYYHTSLSLTWVYGKRMGKQLLPSTVDEEHPVLVHYFDLLHHARILVFDAEAIALLEQMPMRDRFNTNHLPPRLLILADDLSLPRALKEFARFHQVPIFTSPCSAKTIIEQLAMDSAQSATDEIILHGVYLDVLGLGTLLMGESGVGKSEIALGLINNGHCLIADDAVILKKNGEDVLVGSCPPSLQDFLEVRGLGVINIRAMFGENAIRISKPLQLIVHVVPMDQEEIHLIDRLEGLHAQEKILEVTIPSVTIPVSPGRNLSVLVEGAVRHRILALGGYNASEAFIERQQRFIEAQSS